MSSFARWPSRNKIERITMYGRVSLPTSGRYLSPGDGDQWRITMADLWSPSSGDLVLFFPDARTRTTIICYRHFLRRRVDQIWQHRRRFLASHCVEKHSIVAVRFETTNLSWIGASSSLFAFYLYWG